MVTARHTRTAAPALVLLALALTGCGSGTDDAKAPATVPATTAQAPVPTTSPADPQEAEKAAVLAAYGSMWAEQMKAYRKADAKGTALRKYATLTALSKFELDLAHMRKNGTVIRGELGHTPEVAMLDMTGKLPKATVQDCVDLSRWQTLDTRTGKVIPLPSAQPRRYVATATAEKWPNGWMVTDYTPEGARTC